MKSMASDTEFKVETSTSQIRKSVGRSFQERRRKTLQMRSGTQNKICPSPSKRTKPYLEKMNCITIMAPIIAPIANFPSSVAKK